MLEYMYHNFQCTTERNFHLLSKLCAAGSDFFLEAKSDYPTLFFYRSIILDVQVVLSSNSNKIIKTFLSGTSLLFNLINITTGSTFLTIIATNLYDIEGWTQCCSGHSNHCAPMPRPHTWQSLRKIWTVGSTGPIVIRERTFAQWLLGSDIINI